MASRSDLFEALGRWRAAEARLQDELDRDPSSERVLTARRLLARADAEYQRLLAKLPAIDWDATDLIDELPGLRAAGTGRDEKSNRPAGTR